MKKPLKKETGHLMIGVAVFYDTLQILLQLIPFIGQIMGVLVSVFAFLTFFVWFKLYGVSFTNKKRASIAGVGTLVEAIPLLGIFPTWTLSVILIIRDVHKHQKPAKVETTSTT